MSMTRSAAIDLLQDMEQHPSGWDRMDVVKLLQAFDFELVGVLGEGDVERWRHRVEKRLDVTLDCNSRGVHPARILHVVRVTRNLVT